MTRYAVPTGLLAFLFLFWAGDARAEPLYNTPVYHPESGSYFELVDLVAAYGRVRFPKKATYWRISAELASQRFHQGRRGRLAVIDTPEKNNFLRKTFKAEEPAWIGLRYWCGYGKLKWITGKTLKPGDYQNWDVLWSSHTGHRQISGPVGGYCGGREVYWPVHYWSANNGFRWNANGYNKHRSYFFVEYPPKPGEAPGEGGPDEEAIRSAETGTASGKSAN